MANGICVFAENYNGNLEPVVAELVRAAHCIKETTGEKIQAAVQAVKIYGAPGADENTPYLLPKFRSFEDFLKHKLKNNPEGYTFEWMKQSA